jgi:soluble lytic murein transglycosylase
MFTRHTTFRLAAWIGASALFGLGGAWIQERSAGPGLFGWSDGGRYEPRFIAPEVPFLRESEQADAAARARLAAAERDAKPASDERAELDMTGFSEAIAFYKAGDLAKGDAEAKAAKDPLVQTALEWIALRLFPRASGLDRLQAFAAAHPTWPAQGWLRRRSEEALFGDRKNASLIQPYFNASRPETPAGKLALARTLKDSGKDAEAAALVRDVWRDSNLNATLENKIKSDFMAYLDKADHKYRADRLLYKERTAPSALRIAALAGKDALALAKARAAVVKEAASDKLLAAVPASLRSDPGYLFAKIQKLRRADKIGEAVDVLLSAPRKPELIIDGDEWWIERRLLARKLLDRNDPKTAYKICAEHSAASPAMQIEAEFHAGWIALRFMNDPSRAAPHFAAAAALAETPMSLARAAYWQGRAAEASSAEASEVVARSFYKEAAVHPTTYYGQLAREKLGLPIAPIRTIANEANGAAREDAIKVIELLFAAGEKDLATPLVTEAVRHLDDEAQVAALASVVAKQRDANVSLTVGKLASQRGIAIDTLAFPIYGVPEFEPLQNSAGPSLVYSIARQESAFRTSAVSTAGAKGLMQMITSTARRTADRAGVPFSESRLLADAAFNAQLAAAHIGDLLDEQRGSYILTFAAYNAGGGRVKQWINAYGDPRKPGVDPIDWIERIPFTETRNYVQRIIENLAIYRIRFGEASPTQEPILRTQAKL